MAEMPSDITTSESPVYAPIQTPRLYNVIFFTINAVFSQWSGE